MFYNMKVYCVFSLESPHRGDSNDYTQYTIFNMNKKKHPKLSQICIYGIFPRYSRTAVVNEPSVFKPLKFYCIFQRKRERECVYVLNKDWHFPENVPDKRPT